MELGGDACRKHGDAGPDLAEVARCWVDVYKAGQRWRCGTAGGWVFVDQGLRVCVIGACRGVRGLCEASLEAVLPGARRSGGRWELGAGWCDGDACEAAWA
ncbi:hypothetical protein Taro_056050 [Colocasia esculenta]|uniref:Uncharacterized protein n=1 Tax=Colocasia esculenta TaxID=4460 RepID=A0A843XSW7_COLES|nr:hypothetical protein [Colocasia esculenta]